MADLDTTTLDPEALDEELRAIRAEVAELERSQQETAEKEAERLAMEALLSGAADGSADARGASNTAASNDVAASAGQEHAGGAEAQVEEEDPTLVDSRSVYVGNVDYSATPEEIQQHFASCGSINRVTILCDKFSGNPKGYAYVEFADPSFVDTALALNESLFKGRLIKVTAKRTNIPGFNARGRGRGRGGYRGGFNRGGHSYNPYSRPRGRGRGRGRGF